MTEEFMRSQVCDDACVCFLRARQAIDATLTHTTVLGRLGLLHCPNQPTNQLQMNERAASNNTFGMDQDQDADDDQPEGEPGP